MSGDHGHNHGSVALRASARHMRPLLISLGLIVTFLIVQVVTGLLSGSLALLSDSGHMATDALGLGMALAAIRVASSVRSHSQRTFGLYRLEILAALANAALLFGVAGYIGFEAVNRLGGTREVSSAPVLIVGSIGLVVNVIAFMLLRAGSKESLNVQAAPAHLNVASLQADLAAIAGVVDVHDVHVWTLTSEMDVASAHVMITSGFDSHAVLDQARELLAKSYGISHATLQVEPSDHDGCKELTW